MAEKIGLPPYQGLPFDYRAPDLDGLCEWEIGVPDPLIESGWVAASRVTYGVSSGIPVASVQLLKDRSSNDFIYLSFVARFDVAFDDNDAILIVLQPNFSTASHTASTRRLLIRPIINPLGAGPGDSPPNPNPDLVLMVPSPGGGTVSIPIRTNRKVVTTFSKWQPGGTDGTWGSVSAPTGWDIKARSWKVSDTDLNWSVEIKLPATKAAGGTDWIDLDPTSFGLYFNLLRFSTPPTILNFAQVTEFSWPRGHVISDNDGGPYASLTDIMIPASRMGEASLNSAGRGVYFDGGWSSIGVLSGSTVTDVIDGTLNAVNTLVANLKNDSTIDDAPNVRAEFRLADFGIGPNPNGSWQKVDPAASGTPGPNNTNPTKRIMVPKNDVPVQVTMDWKIDAAVRAKYLGHGNDQCLLALLDSDRAVTFRESSYRRNIRFNNLSSFEGEAVVSGEGYPPPPAGQSNHEFLLVTSQRLMSSMQAHDGWRPRLAAPSGPIEREGSRPGTAVQVVRTPATSAQFGKTASPLGSKIFDRWNNAKDPSYSWISVTTAYRRTQATLTLGATPYSVVELADSFSDVLFHEGPVQRWESTLGGQGVTRLAPGLHLISVPHGGKGVLKLRYEALTGFSLGRLPWWVWLVLFLAILLAILVLS